MLKQLCRAISLITLVILGGCGGGGGGEAVIASIQTFNLQAAYTAYLSQSYTKAFNISGTYSGVNVSGTGSITSGTLQSGTFLGLPALVKTNSITGTFNANGQTIPLGLSTQSYYDSNYNTKGISGGNFSVVTMLNAIPTSAKVNDTGVWMILTNYPTSARSYSVGTSTITYAVNADSASSVLLTFITTEKSTSGSILSTSTEIYRVTSTNVVTPISESLLQGVSALTLTYQ